MSPFRDLLEGKIDFHGQKDAEYFARIGLIIFTVLSFVLGFTLQSVWVTMETFGLGTIILALAVVPPWSIYNKRPVKWAPAQPALELKSK